MSEYAPLTQRQDGITTAERYLKRLCDKTFLSLWSYPGVYRHQGGQGKEVCDLLVVCGNHVIIMSDKDCAFPDSGDIKLDWSRWYRRAILASAQQTWGAESTLRGRQNPIFANRACSQPFPLKLPDPATAVYHRVVVAHGVAERCRQYFGGGSNGSLMIDTAIIGEAHYDKDSCRPFFVGIVDENKGFVHILDDESVDVVLGNLDTITDFVTYLVAREALLTSGIYVSATGEEELLAFYLREINPKGDHDFIIPSNTAGIFLQEGIWNDFRQSKQYIAKIEADKISYSWDDLIERFCQHILAGTQYWKNYDEIATGERIIRFLASEPRVRRRMLVKNIIDLDNKNYGAKKAFRVIGPSRHGDPYYAILLLDTIQGISDEEYREFRRKLLHAYCMVIKVVYSDAEDIVGLAFQSLSSERSSEDALYMDARSWTPELQAEAEVLQQEYGILNNVCNRQYFEKEYPDLQPIINNTDPNIVTKRKPGRNDLCPCGSGKKFKKCCMR